VRGAFEDLPKDGTDGDELPPLESHLGGLRRSSDFFETFDFAARFLILRIFFLHYVAVCLAGQSSLASFNGLC
jgi:hypothetical protein